MVSNSKYTDCEYPGGVHAQQVVCRNTDNKEKDSGRTDATALTYSGRSLTQ